MKRSLKTMITALLLLCMVMAMPVAASAAVDAAQQDGLQITIETDKDTYEEGEEVLVLISVKNTNAHEVSGISVNALLPDGLMLKDGNAAQENITIPAGDTFSTMVTVVEENAVTESTTEATTEATTTPTTEATTAPTTEATTAPTTEATTAPTTEATTAPTTATTKPAASGGNQNGPQTGDEFSILLALTVAVVSGVCIVLLIWNRKRLTRIFSFLLCLVIVASLLPAEALAVDPTQSAEVSKSIQIGGKEFAVQAKVSWQSSQIQPPATDDSTITRGEWITLLANKMGITAVENADESTYFYGDSAESAYGPLAETLYAMNILPAPDSEGYEDPEQDIPMFEANKIVTREYAAYTVAKVMAFECKVEYECADKGSIRYPDEVGVILQQGFLVLNAENAFAPNAPLTGTDRNRIFTRMDVLNESLTVDEDERINHLVLQSDVVEVENTEYTLVKNADGTYTVTVPADAQTAALAQEQVIMLPASGSQDRIALEIQSVSQEGTTITLICAEPDIEEVVKEFEFAGEATVDISGMTVTDGVTAEYDPNGAVSGGGEDVAPFDLGGTIPLPGKLTYHLYEKELGNSGVTVSGKVDFSVPAITAKAKGKVFGGFSLDELTVSITKKLEITAEAEYDFGIPESSFDVSTGRPTFGTGKTELGRLPVKLGATGLSLDFVLFINLDVSGTVSITYAIESTEGFQYKDGAFRLIKDYTSEFKTLEINATAKVGIGLAVRISLFSVFDLAGIDAHAGLGITAKFTVHADVSPVLHCGDGTIYFYATVELDEDTLIVALIKKIKKFSWKWEIFNEDNSPLKWNLHLENGKKVAQCTYGKGHILGTIKSAETGEPIGGARVEVYNASTGRLITTARTQYASLILSGFQLYKGEFLLQNLPTGTYRLKVTATGYKAYEITVDVISNQRVVCEAALMLLREEMTEKGTVSGSITNALTGATLPGASYNVRANWNTVEGDVVASGTLTDASYLLELDPGYYTLEIYKEGFISACVNIVVHSNQNTVKNIAISPTSGVEMESSSFRVVLTWGQYPSDLDSHLYYKDADGNVAYHTWYRDMSYYENDEMIANLDVDDISSYGPETTTVYSMAEDGVYSFYVHNYSNRMSGNSTVMSESEALLKIYSGEALVATFPIPQNREGTLWHVFDYDAATDTFTYVNEFSYAERG